MSPLDDIKTFNEVVVGPIEERKEIGLARLRVVMSALAIRRTKGEVKREISLKKKTINIRKIEFPDDNLHKKVSFMLYHTCRNAFLALMQKGNKAWGRKQFLLFGLGKRRQLKAHSLSDPMYVLHAVLYGYAESHILYSIFNDFSSLFNTSDACSSILCKL